MKLKKMGFVKGMLAGVLAGGAVMLLFDPITPRQRRKMRRQANRMMHSVGDMFDNMTCEKQ